MNVVYYKVTFQDDSPYLQHYGVLGMKWGHRKDGMPQGTIGSGSARGRARVNSVLSDRQKKIAKGIAIGAGVAALGIGAHMTGADRAVINAVRGAAKGYGHRYGVKGLARSTRNQVNISRKLGKAGMRGVGSSSKAIGSQVKANAAKMKRSNPLGNLYLKGASANASRARAASQSSQDAAAAYLAATGQATKKRRRWL